MTPEQLDHLRAIDAHLTALLDIAAKRTPGEWKPFHEGEFLSCDFLAFSFVLPKDLENAKDDWVASNCQSHDAAFIAACAGRAEAGWRATLLAITGLQSVINMTEDHGIRLCAEAGLKTILSAWPRELLTMP